MPIPLARYDGEMEKFEYSVFSGKDLKSLQETMNTLGSAGYRVKLFNQLQKSESLKAPISPFDQYMVVMEKLTDQ